MKKGAIVGVISVLAVLALVAAGCGGGDDETTETLTKVQFVKQGNAICEESDRERATQFQLLTQEYEQGGLSESEKEKMVTEAFVDPYAEMVDSLQELGVPKGDEKEVEAIIQAMEKGLQKLEDDPLSGLADTSMFKEASQLSQKYGLTGCVV